MAAAGRGRGGEGGPRGRPSRLPPRPQIPPADRRGIPHHLLDILDPDTDFSAGDFFGRARDAIEGVLARGRVPVVVGGTGLYLRWLVHGKPAAPPGDDRSAAAARAAVDAAVAAAEDAAGRRLAGAERWAAATGALAAAGDPASAAIIQGERNNEYRLLRALEIVLATGRPRGECLSGEGGGGAPPPPLDYDFRAFFLHRDRVSMYRAIDARAEGMLRGGLLREAGDLLAAGQRAGAGCATRAIGYRQAAEALEAAAAAAAAREAPPSERDAVTLCAAVQAASRRLAHSQLAWFRGDPLYRWVDVSGRAPAEVAAEIAALASAPVHAPGPPGAGRLTKESEAELKRYSPVLTTLASLDAQAGVATELAAVAAALPPAARAAAAAAGAERAAVRHAQSAASAAAREGRG